MRIPVPLGLAFLAETTPASVEPQEGLGSKQMLLPARSSVSRLRTASIHNDAIVGAGHCRHD